MKKQLMHYLFIAVLLSVFFLVFSISKTAEAETFYVDDAGGAEFSTIQAAINAANKSDVIEVYSGTYNENIVINQTLTLSGSGAETTTIIGVSSNENTVEITADNVTLSGFNIDNTNGASKMYHCLHIAGSNNCKISDNIFKNGYNGLYIQSSNDNIFSNNIFKDNYQKGIRLSSANSNSIKQNEIKNNGDGIRLTSSNLNEIFENIISGNNYGISIASCSNNNIIYKNDFDNGINAEVSCSISCPESSCPNSWDKNGQGNYWDDYNDYDNNSDDYGDNSYEISEDNVDAFPLGDFLTVDAVAYIDSISPNPATNGEIIDFYGHGTPPENILDWEWRSNRDGLLNQGSADFSSSSLSVGTHTISFRVFDGQWSEYDTDTLIISSASSSENQNPVATIVSISPVETVEGESLYMHGYGTDTDGMIVGYSWQSNKDGVISSESSFTISTLSVGTHSISFKVKDNDGGWSHAETATVVITQNMSLNQNPVAITDGSYAGEVNTTIIFDGAGSYDPDEDDLISSYEWDFGDGKSGSGKIIAHTYNRSGNFTVTLTVKDRNDGQTTVSSFALITNQSSNSHNDVDSNKTSSDSSKDFLPEIPGFGFFFIIVGLVVVLSSKRFFRKY